jgi:hypothetical protein
MSFHIATSVPSKSGSLARMKNRFLRSSILAAGAFMAIGSVAIAHSTGHESRTSADCEKLPGTATTGERAGCLACIARNTASQKFHYHPDYPAGNRCRPDDGKP